MGPNVVLIAVVSGILYFLGTSKIGYHLTATLGSPIFSGFVLGLLFGNVAQGLIIGASIQLIYLGIINTGGNVPADQALAATVAIPIALYTNMDPVMAVSLAVPFGVLGAFLDQIRRTSNSIWVNKADICAENGDSNGIFKNAYIYPALFALCLRFIPVFMINLVGPDAVQYALEVLPVWILTGFKVAGGLLPALGFAIIIVVIGRKDLFPYFIIGFFAVQYLHINAMSAAIFGSCIAILVTLSAKKKGEIENE
jgi:D-glucosaminate-specific PTS system IIC component